LLAGISGYESSADILNRASMDAVDFYSFLTSDQNVPGDHVILLVDDMATAERFRSSMGDLLDRAGSEDRVIVFFSGHGTQYEPGSGGAEENDSANEAICLYDDDVEDDWLARTIASEASAPVLFFVDACNSGGLVNDFSEDSNVLILTAAREDRSVSERILTPILLDGCRGAADLDADGWVTASELAEYVDERLQRICPECDAELSQSAGTCPECGAALKGENSVPRPEQGLFLTEDLQLWQVDPGKASQ
jgi:ribosomal protein L40E